MAPVFIGANPARVLSGPQTGFRLLAAEEDLGRELVTLLPDEHRKIAVINDTAFPTKSSPATTRRCGRSSSKDWRPPT